MISDFVDACIGLVIVGILWGATNPFIKKGGVGIEKVKARNAISQFFYETKFLMTNWRYVVPFGLNQIGSVVFFLILQKTDLSLAVPVANSLSFVFNAIAGVAIGEKLPGKGVTLGVLLVLAGISLCVWDKASLAD